MTVSKNKVLKTTTTHPRTGSSLKIDSNIYGHFKSAIIKSLKGSDGMTFSDLTNDVTRIIRKELPEFKKSIPWYTISIRLDLETKGIVETFTGKGKKLNRLSKKFSK
ncbi:MAG TPA: hypothetical protein PKC72_04685 [Chitinophagaceae bacterium]|nr:hypothetical protein [Chitinophagaceae bacterium]